MGRQKGFSLWRVLSALFALVVLIGWTTFHANLLMGRSLLFAFPGWETSYHSAWPNPLGGAVASDVTLIPPAGLSDGGTFHFDHVSVEVPFVEYFRSTFSSKLDSIYKPIHRLQFEFTGGTGDLYMALMGEMAVFGNLTAAPFEVEGCTKDDYWVASDLEAMGLSPGNVTLTLDYHSESGTFIKKQTLTAPDIGSVSLLREIVQPGEYAMLTFTGGEATALAADAWQIKDDGFVVARNRYCASKDGIDVDEFVQRHVRSVKRLLAIVGAAPTASLEKAYFDYARNGGSLGVEVRYDPPLSGQVYDADALSAWLPYMRGEFSVNGATEPLTLVATEPRPWPEWAGALTTFELVQRENAVAPTDDARAPIAAAPATRTPSAISAQSTYAPAPAPAQSPATPTLISTAAPSKSLASALIAATPDSVAAVGDGTISDYRQLADYVGKRLTIYQRGRPTVYVKILSVTENGAVWVRRKFRSGYMEYTLDRKTFERAEK